jgi:hypothetical protein
VAGSIRASMSTPFLFAVSSSFSRARGSLWATVAVGGEEIDRKDDLLGETRIE